MTDSYYELEQHRREPTMYEWNVAKTSDPGTDYGPSGQQLEMAVTHLRESICNGQRLRTFRALHNAELALKVMRRDLTARLPAGMRGKGVSAGAEAPNAVITAPLGATGYAGGLVTPTPTASATPTGAEPGSMYVNQDGPDGTEYVFDWERDYEFRNPDWDMIFRREFATRMTDNTWRLISCSETDVFGHYYKDTWL